MAATAALTPRMRRITLHGASLVNLTVTPAQDIEVILAEPGAPRVKRRYTIRSARPAAGEIDIEALIHEHGPGGRWAGAAAVGDRLDFLGPRGHLELRRAGWHLFVGDEAGLPAIASIIEALPIGEPATVLAEVGDESDEVALGSAAVTWCRRGDTAPGGSALLGAAVAELAPRPDGRAYLLGESRAMIAVRPGVEALGIPIERMYVKGYWNLGRGSRLILPAQRLG